MGDTIAVIATRDMEVEAICSKASTQSVYRVMATRPVYKCTYGDDVVYVIKARPGLVNAALSAQLLIDHFNPDLLISVGLCAAVDDDIPVGTLVLADAFVRYDVGTYTDAGFIHGTASYRKTHKEPMIKQQNLVAWNALCGKLQTHAVQNVCLASGAGFIRSKYKRMWIREKLEAKVVDMSGAAIETVTSDNMIPSIVFRQVSDKGDRQAGRSFGLFAAKDDETLINAVYSTIAWWHGSN